MTDIKDDVSQCSTLSIIKGPVTVNPTVYSKLTMTHSVGGVKPPFSLKLSQTHSQGLRIPTQLSDLIQCSHSKLQARFSTDPQVSTLNTNTVCAGYHLMLQFCMTQHSWNTLKLLDSFSFLKFRITIIMNKISYFWEAQNSHRIV